MPRKNPLAESEIAVGRRLAQARKEGRIPRAALAVELGISTERLYTYETGRSKLPWGVAARSCKFLDIHPAWLAGEVSHLGLYVEHEMPGLSDEERERLPFTEVYQRYFTPEMRDVGTAATDKINASLRNLEASLKAAHADGFAPTPAHREQLKKIASQVAQLAQRMLRVPKASANKGKKGRDV